MESTFRMARISESQIDSLILECGGSKFDADGIEQGVKNADYVFRDSLIELKIVEEEGLEKTERQQRIADLFLEEFPDDPVVVIDRNRLSIEGKRRFDRAIERPIKKLVAKASKQLKETTGIVDFEVKSRVLLILNNGYMSLSHEQFDELVMKCVRNDTSGIDHVLVGGMYLYGDGFDHYVIANLEDRPVLLATAFDSKALGKSWGSLVQELVTSMITSPSRPMDGKGDVDDIWFEHKERTFVKTKPLVGKESQFWVNGRPRRNSTGIEECPIVASVLPGISNLDWASFKETLDEENSLLGSKLSDWHEFRKFEESSGEKLRPNVFVKISFESWKKHLASEAKEVAFFSELCEFATLKFHSEMRRLISAAVEVEDESQILSTEFLYLSVWEIGSDKAWDYSEIRMFSTVPGFEKAAPASVAE